MLYILLKFPENDINDDLVIPDNDFMIPDNLDMVPANMFHNNVDLFRLIDQLDHIICD
jgi:hypothetical protein